MRGTTGWPFSGVTRRVRSALFYRYAQLRGHHFSRYDSEYRAELREGGVEIRRRRLSEMLRVARAKVPYYRHLNVSQSSDVFAELAQYPILTKDTIRSQGDRMHASDASRRHSVINTSGGSTGEPVAILQDREFTDRTQALCSLLYERMGYRFGELQYRLWGSEQEVLRGLSRAARFWQRVYNLSMLNAFCMSQDSMRQHLRLLDQAPPRLFVCYAQAAYELARFAEANDIAVKSPHAIACSAGTLYPFMRQVIERVFRCPVYNWYGSREVGVIATQLPGERQLWIPAAAQYVEVVDENGQLLPAGVEGDIVITCLSNLSMPLIRYCIGDRGALAPTSSDGIQRLDHLTGRNVDMFLTRTGTRVDGEYFTHILYFRPWIAKFQFVQTDYDHVQLRIVAADAAARDAASALAVAMPEITSQIQAVLGAGCTVDARLTEDIPTAISGKFRYTMCAIPSSAMVHA